MTQATRWHGWWQQEGYGRQPMHDLYLQFDGGNIQGRGHDMVAPFTFAGKCAQNGAVSLVKKYVGQHHVIYNGSYDGEGTIYGEWNIVNEWGVWMGPFVFTLDGRSVREVAEAVTEAPAPIVEGGREPSRYESTSTLDSRSSV